MSISSYSTIVIGAGISSFWGFYLAFTLLGIYAGAEDYPTLVEIRQLRSDLRLDLDRFLSSDPSALTMFLMIPVATFGIFVGIVISIGGFLIFAYQQANRISPYPKKKKVSIPWQIVCSFFPGFDWWALYRIKKLRIGLIIFAASQASGLVILYNLIPDYGDSFVVIAVSSLIYLGFVFVFSRDWNKSLESKEYSPKGNTTIFTG